MNLITADHIKFSLHEKTCFWDKKTTTSKHHVVLNIHANLYLFILKGQKHNAKKTLVLQVKNYWLKDLRLIWWPLYNNALASTIFNSSWGSQNQMLPLLFTQQVAVDMEQPGQAETFARPENKHLYLSTTNEISSENNTKDSCQLHDTSSNKLVLNLVPCSCC